ncbi:MAG: ABC transporter ATP-binding protein [Candidatus Obscuribacterales bacterium]|nr:ABC transporter ATP-binding protein [Candidatus Obscuribacterales bacterium]
MTEPRIEVSNLSVGYKPDLPILAHISFSISKGSITAIAGPNGSGKSTLIKALARQIKSSSGKITLQDIDIWSLSPADYARRCAYVPQSFNPTSSLTVGELVALGRNPHQRWWSWNASREDLAATDQALCRAGLSTLKDRYIATLSGGERQRALIAIALAQEADFVLLDEPINHLDFKYQRAVVALLAELKKENKGVVVILHDLNVINSIADQVVMITKKNDQPGEIVEIGTSDQMLNAKTIKQVFDVDISEIVDPESGRRFFHIA